VRWGSGEAEREWKCLALLAEHAPGVAPRPLRRETYHGGPVVVMERIPGDPLGRSPVTGEQTMSLGRALRRLYDVPLELILDANIGERSYGPTTQQRTSDVLPEPQLVALGIADLNPANVLWDGQRCRLVDFEGPTDRSGRRSGWPCCCRATAASGATRRGRPRHRRRTCWHCWVEPSVSCWPAVVAFPCPWSMRPSGSATVGRRGTG